KSSLLVRGGRALPFRPSRSAPLGTAESSAMTAASVNREQGAGGRELQHLRRPPAHARYVRLSADASANLRLNTTCHGCQAEAVLSMAATSRATWSCAAGL